MNIGVLKKFFVFSLLTSVLSFNCMAQSELVNAINIDDKDRVRALLDQGFDINASEKDGSTPLQWAVYNGNDELVEDLLSAGADAELSNREGITPLILAVQGGYADITEVLLKSGADVNRTLGGGETPLMMAVRTGDVETIQVVLDYGAEINVTENLRGTSALMWAAASKNSAAIELLLENGADIALHSGTTSPGRNPYLAPTARDRIREFYLGTGFRGASLEDDQILLTREDLIERLPASLVEEFNVESAQIELSKQNEVEPPPEKQWGGLTALHLAVREGDLPSVKILVEHGANVNQVSEFGWTPLLTATQNRYYKLASYLIEQGANTNIANDGGWNPLYIATDNRNIEGGDYPTRKPDMKHLDYIKLLLKEGANPNLRMQSSTETRTIFTHQWLDEAGATPFLRAAQSSDLELMQLLLEYGADPQINTLVGVTPLMVASGIAWVEGVTYEWSEEANEEAIAMLLDLGNDPNARDIEDGRTALMGAAHKGRNYGVQMLVDAGADPSTRDIGSRDSIHILTGKTWQAIDYADGLVRVGVQSADSHEETSYLLRSIMLAKGMDVPEEGRTLDSICIVDICK